ncbi:MAG: NAD(P)H-binding protein [Algicola sp.]|nr:NAD(P)H-binding protein [Algicola sp.]
MKQHICIIGCGWLGLPLATSLIKKGHLVKGSTTSSEKISGLNSVGIKGFLVELSSEGISGEIENCLAGCDTLVLNIPPGLRKHPEANYVKQMQHILPFVEASAVKQVLFVGSTSVYDDDELIPVISEASPTSTRSNAAQQILTVEALFQNNLSFKTTILRFSGLIGKDRHPATFLSGKTNLKNPDAPVNLIHQSDCITVIEKIIEQNIWNTVLNAATPSHPSRKSYYTSVCKSQNLPLPSFHQTQQSKGKIIDSTKLARVLDYEFKIKL